MIGKLLDQYGIPVELEGRTVRGLFQPLTGKLERLAVRVPDPLGCGSAKRFVYIGPVQPQPREDGELTVAGRAYLVRASHLIPGNDGPAYCWAMCVEKGQEDTWGMNS